MTFCCGYVPWQDGSENFAKCFPCLPAPWWLLIYQAMHLTFMMLCWSCFSSLFYLSSPSPQLYSSPSNIPRHPLMFITCFSPCIYYQPPWIAFPSIFISSASTQITSSSSFLGFCSCMFLKPKLQCRFNCQIQLSLQSSHDLLLKSSESWKEPFFWELDLSLAFKRSLYPSSLFQPLTTQSKSPVHSTSYILFLVRRFSSLNCFPFVISSTLMASTYMISYFLHVFHILIFKNHSRLWTQQVENPIHFSPPPHAVLPLALHFKLMTLPILSSN